MENEKIKIKEKIIEENKNKITEIKNKIKTVEEKINEKNNFKNKFDNKNEKNKLNKKIKIIGIIILLLNILWLIFIPKTTENKLIKYIFLLTVPIFLICSIFLKNKLNKKIKNIEKNYNIEKEKINIEKNN